MKGLKVAKDLGAKNVLLKSDSRLVIGQINNKYEAKENKMQKYLKLTNELIGEFDKVSFVQVPRGQNSVVRISALKSYCKMLCMLLCMT